MAKKRTGDRHKPSKLIRIPPALYDELEAIADANERPVHWEARIAIRKHIEDETSRKSTDQPAKE